MILTHRSCSLLTVAIGAALLAGASLAQADGSARGGQRDPDARWAQLDRNGDGAIDRTEAAAQPRLAERFDRLDRDGDGRVTRDELREARRAAEAQREARQAQARAMRARFDWLDVNDDRALTLAELGDHAPKLRERFVAIDSDRDGRLLPEEIRAFRDAQRETKRAARA